MGVQQNVTKGSFTNVLSPILKLPLNRRMSEKESAELKTIGGNGNAMGMVNFVHRILHDTRELQSVTFGPHVEGEACKNKKTQKISWWVEVNSKTVREKCCVWSYIAHCSWTSSCDLCGLVLRWSHEPRCKLNSTSITWSFIECQKRLVCDVYKTQLLQIDRSSRFALFTQE